MGVLGAARITLTLTHPYDTLVIYQLKGVPTMARSQKELAEQIVQQVDLKTIVDLAAERVAGMFPWDAGSGDQEDYAYASAQCLAELMNIVRSYQSQYELTEWLATHPTEWYASDGDIRFDITMNTNNTALITEWDEMIEMAWEQ